ncbi:MAG TPA: DUF5677 domain-containing protein [Phycisphaerae bacterium]|nr:DUF5677 domain-containing protein [Phycisphaerae bacterium]
MESVSAIIHLAMNTPRKDLLDRQVQKELQPGIDRVTGMMERCVNYGTHLVVKCDQAGRQKDVLPVVMLGLHVVELLDSISVLIRNRCVDPAKILLRSEMEGMFGIEYMARSDSVRKARQYLVVHAHKRIDSYKRFDPTTKAGKQLQAQLNKDSTFHNLETVCFDTGANIANLEKMLTRPEYAEVEAEWQRLRGQKSGQIWWHSLFSGPNRIEELAATVGEHALYQLLYRFYSGESHATNALDSLHVTQDQRPEYQPLRYPLEAPTVAQIAVSMALRTYRALIDMLVPDENQSYADWYTREIKTDFMELAAFKIVDVGRKSIAPSKRANS